VTRLALTCAGYTHMNDGDGREDVEHDGIADVLEKMGSDLQHVAQRFHRPVPTIIESLKLRLHRCKGCMGFA